VRRLLLATTAAAALLVATTATAAASTWCGSPATADLVPQVTPGPSVHFVYAYPSDGVDRIAEEGTTMQTDAETIDAWWRSQDPTRTPRFDTFAFPCGGQLDISDVRLPLSAAELTPNAGRFDKIVAGISTTGLTSPYEIYVVYYDGPDDDSGICGQGGTRDPSHGQAYAVVFTGGCRPEPTAVTAVHELTHALGAVISPAPNECPVPNDGHVCDSNRDLMYPFIDGSPLSALTLDVGRNDYYGATGVGFDVRASRWLRHLDEAPSHLTVGLTGTGTVASDVPGFTCTASCASDWDGGQQVTLSAAPGAGQRFVRWGSSCTGDQPCQLTLAGAVSVTALFAPLTFPLTLGVHGKGGVLDSATAGFCRKRCRVAVTSYQPISLRAVAQPGWRFRRWAGSCLGTRPGCTLPMTSAASSSAIFAKKRSS
jgi:hypothetical protein